MARLQSGGTPVSRSLVYGVLQKLRGPQYNSRRGGVKSFIHMGKIGDVLSSLPVVREMGGGELYLKADFAIDFTPDAVLALAPLLDEQGYVQARIWEKEKADIDLDLFRHTVLRLRCSDMRRLYIYTFNVHPDLSQPFLAVEAAPGYENAVVVERSLRYRNNNIAYKFLQDKHFEGWYSWSAGRSSASSRAR